MCENSTAMAFPYRKSTFPNVCYLVELVLAIGPSNSVVESVFSHLTAMLSDRRLSLQHSTMEDLLLLKCNKARFSGAALEDLLESSVESFLQKRRKRKLEDKADMQTDKCRRLEDQGHLEEEEAEESEVEVMMPFDSDTDSEHEEDKDEEDPQHFNRDDFFM